MRCLLCRILIEDLLALIRRLLDLVEPTGLVLVSKGKVMPTPVTSVSLNEDTTAGPFVVMGTTKSGALVALPAGTSVSVGLDVGTFASVASDGAGGAVVFTGLGAGGGSEVATFTALGFNVSVPVTVAASTAITGIALTQ